MRGLSASRFAGLPRDSRSITEIDYGLRTGPGVGEAPLDDIFTTISQQPTDVPANESACAGEENTHLLVRLPSAFIQAPGVRRRDLRKPMASRTGFVTL